MDAGRSFLFGLNLPEFVQLPFGFQAWDRFCPSPASWLAAFGGRNAFSETPGATDWSRAEI